MSNKIIKIHKYRDDKLHLFLRDDSRYWLCRFFADGRYKVKSTKEEKHRQAKQFAENWYDDLRYKQRHGISIHQKKFGDVADEYIEYQQTLVKNYTRSIQNWNYQKNWKDKGFI